jgi:hypothetical protein
MKLILFIDDNISEVVGLAAALPKDIFVYWCPDLQTGKTILNSRVYDFKMVITDVSGVTLGDFPKEVSELKHKNIVITSNVLSPVSDKHRFVLKDGLVDLVLREFQQKPA